jgi:hypothetical protein
MGCVFLGTEFPHLRLTKHYLCGGARRVLCEDPNRTRLLGRVTCSIDIMMIHKQVDVAPISYDSNQVGLT